MDELHLKYVCESCDWESTDDPDLCPECGEPVTTYYLADRVAYDTPDGPDVDLTWKRYT